MSSEPKESSCPAKDDWGPIWYGGDRWEPRYKNEYVQKPLSPELRKLIHSLVTRIEVKT